MTLLALFACRIDEPAPDPCAAEGVICTVAGTGAPGLSPDGMPLRESAIYWPSAVRQGPDGLLAVCDSNSHRIRAMAPDDTFRSIVGSGVHAFSVVDQPATDSPLDFPVDFQFLPGGEILVAILHENAVRIVEPDGTFRAFAGSRIYGYEGDGGPAIDAQMSAVSGVAVDDEGVVYIADTENQVIRAVGLDGLMTTLAGRGIPGFAGDGGPAAGALLDGPSGLSVHDGELVIADSRNHAIRSVDLTTGVIRTLAGTGAAGEAGDGGPALEAELNYPLSALYSPNGELWIADTYNNRVRVVDIDGTIRTAIGTGARAYSGDEGPAEDAEIAFPADLFFDGTGALWISDMANGSVRRMR